jgi:hypothetical protein
LILERESFTSSHRILDLYPPIGTPHRFRYRYLRIKLRTLLLYSSHFDPVVHVVTIAPPKVFCAQSSGAAASGVPPSSICSQRKMSTAVTTTEETQHELLEGRERVVMTPPRKAPTSRTKSVRHSHTSSGVPQTPKPKRGSLGSQLRRNHSLTGKIEMSLADFCIDPLPLRMESWSEACASNFGVRGKTYVKDRKKENSEECLFKLLVVDLVKVDKPIMTGMCSHPNERVQRALRREKETGEKELPEFIFCINYCIPADPYSHWVAYFGTDDLAALRDTSTPIGKLTEPFFFGDDDEFRKNTFKLIPRIVEGNFVVKKAVGTKPTILGRKLKQYYIQDPRFFELVVDMGSDPVAERILKLALGAAKNLVVDMMFLLEGTDETTLPERILAGTRVERLDFKKKGFQRDLLDN